MKFGLENAANLKLKGYVIYIGFKPGTIVGNINVPFQVLFPKTKCLFNNKAFRDASIFFHENISAFNSKSR